MRGIVTLILSTLLLGSGAAWAAERSTAPAQAAPAVDSAPAPRLDLNKATRDELVGIPGIGPRIAQAILDLRSRKGSFVKIEELLEVRGIKQKNLDKIAPLLTIAPRQNSASAVPPAQSR